MPIKSMSIVADLPWSTPGVEEPITYRAQTSLDIEPSRKRRIPYLVQAFNGKLWLFFDNGLVVRQKSDTFQKVNTNEAQINRLSAIAPLADDSLILLGLQDRENVLAAVDRNEKLLWQRTGSYDKNEVGLPSLRGRFDRLLIDTDGSVYLPDKEVSGGIAKIDVLSGDTSQVIDVSEYAADDIFIRNGELFYVLIDDDGRYWVRQPIKTGGITKVKGSEELQALFTYVIGVLPDGGALVDSDDFFAWMSPQGKTVRKINLAGMVRDGQDVFAAVYENNKMIVAHFRDDQIIERDVIESVDKEARLVNVNNKEYTFFKFDNGAKFLSINRKTKEQSFPIRAAGDNLLKIESFVNAYDPVIIDFNTFLYPGTDPQGAFVVRVEFADK